MPTYYNAHGQWITTEKELGRGGEATIWTLAHHSGLVAKIYHCPPKMTGYDQKLQYMIAHPPSDPSQKSGHISIA